MNKDAIPRRMAHATVCGTTLRLLSICLQVYNIAFIMTRIFRITCSWRTYILPPRPPSLASFLPGFQIWQLPTQICHSRPESLARKTSYSKTLMSLSIEEFSGNLFSESSVVIHRYCPTVELFRVPFPVTVVRWLGGYCDTCPTAQYGLFSAGLL